MKVTIKIAIIVLVVTTMTLAPSIIISQSATAASHSQWCENQGKDKQWVFGCQAVWSDHDRCLEYYPVNSKEDYKAGWNHGSCK